jgi:hypothetical protein
MDGDKEYKIEFKKILKHYQLWKVAAQTTYRWMKALGFQYEMQRKEYYADGREKPSTNAYCWCFCEQYLAYEMQMFSWVQMTLEPAKEFKEQGVIVKGNRYHYIDPLTNKKMVEFHVDTSALLLAVGNVSLEDQSNFLLVANP